MKISAISQRIEGNILCESGQPEREVNQAFASDLMSDVLTVKADNLLLITGLVNLQAIRTAEMSDIGCIVFVRNKFISPDLIDLASENGITLIRTPFSMFKTAGLLFTAGIKPVY